MLIFRCEHCGAEETIIGPENLTHSPKRGVNPTLHVSHLFGARVRNCLANADISFVDELLTKRPSELLRLRNLGRGTLREITETLHEHGLHLGSGPAFKVRR